MRNDLVKEFDNENLHLNNEKRLFHLCYYYKSSDAKNKQVKTQWREFSFSPEILNYKEYFDFCPFKTKLLKALEEINCKLKKKGYNNYYKKYIVGVPSGVTKCSSDYNTTNIMNSKKKEENKNRKKKKQRPKNIDNRNLLLASILGNLQNNFKDWEMLTRTNTARHNDLLCEDFMIPQSEKIYFKDKKNKKFLFILLDDVYTTDETCEKCKQKLKEYFKKSHVINLTLAKTEDLSCFVNKQTTYMNDHDREKFSKIFEKNSNNTPF